MFVHSRFNKSAKILTVFLALALILPGCRGGRNNYDDLNEKSNERISEAKDYLAQQRYFDALSAFDDVLENIDPNNNEARYGKVLAELLQFASIIRVVSQLVGFEEAADENDFIISLVRDLLGDLITRFERIEFNLTRLKADPYVQFVLTESTPVYLTASDDPTLDLKGEWDRSDVFLLDAPVQAILGVLKFSDSIDLRADFLGIYNRFVDLDIDFAGAPDIDIDGDPDDDTLEESIFGAVETVEFSFHKIQNLLAWILNKNPDFLGVRPDVGVQERKEAGEHFVNAIESFQRALFFTSRDAQFDLDQTDDIISWGKKPTKYTKESVPEEIDRDLDACVLRDTDDEEDAEYSFSFNFSDEPSEFTTSADASCLIELLKNSFDGTGQRVNLRNDILPVVLGLVGDLADLSVPQDLIDSVATQIFDDFVGNSIELDFGPIFYAPKGLRTFFPAHDTPKVESDPDKWLLHLESECMWSPIGDRYKDNRLAYSFGITAFEDGVTTVERTASDLYYSTRVINRVLCIEKPEIKRIFVSSSSTYCDDPTDTDTCDTDHFTPTLAAGALTFTTVSGGINHAPSASDMSFGEFGISRIGKDGVAGSLPYIGFQDASFNGVLWVDIRNIADDDNNFAALDSSSNFAPASNLTLNALLAYVSANFDPIIDLLGTLN